MTSKQQAALSTCKSSMRYDARELGAIIPYYAEHSGWIKTFLAKLEAFEAKPLCCDLREF